MEDLTWLIYYAEQIKKAIRNGHKPVTAEVQRLSQLAQNIEREYDTDFQAWVDSQEEQLYP